jgi:hypothetical protein
MSELDPDARRILSLARAARTPSPKDQARVARRFALGVGVTAGATLTAGSAKAAKASTLLGPLKLWVLFTAAALSSYLVITPSPATKTLRGVPLHISAPAPPPPPPPAPVPPATPDPPRRQQLQAPPTRPAELDLLHQAQTAWRSRSPTLALELLASHRQLYPRSQLRSERETLEVLARCDLGQTDKATRLARSLLAREPHSPARAAIEQSCGLK